MHSMVHMLETDDKEQIKICAALIRSAWMIAIITKVLVSGEGESQIGQED